MNPLVACDGFTTLHPIYYEPRGESLQAANCDFYVTTFEAGGY